MLQMLRDAVPQLKVQRTVLFVAFKPTHTQKVQRTEPFVLFQQESQHLNRQTDYSGRSVIGRAIRVIRVIHSLILH